MLARTALPRTLVLLGVLLGAQAAHAGGGQAPAGPDDAESVLDLPISLERIQRMLDELPVLDGRDGVLRLNIQVRVFAPAPPIELYRGIDLEHSPPRYGAPVHYEMVSVATPSRLGFRNGTPAVNTGHSISWGGR